MDPCRPLRVLNFLTLRICYDPRDIVDFSTFTIDGHREFSSIMIKLSLH